jgi:hypothetical protein
MIKFSHVDRTLTDTKSSGDSRCRVDAYLVSFHCPRDKVNPQTETHEWICRFEVPRGEKFKPKDYATKADALAARGFKL